MSTVTSEVDEIRRQMAQIRRELHEDVRDVVATAEAVTDWRRYLANYPWAWLGAAFVVGYLIVPKRRTVEVNLSQFATQADITKLRQAVESTERTVADAARPETAKTARKGLTGALLGLLVPVALRAAQGYAVNFLEQWIAQQQPRPGSSHRSPTTATGPRRPTDPGAWRQGSGPA